MNKYNLKRLVLKRAKLFHKEIVYFIIKMSYKKEEVVKDYEMDDHIGPLADSDVDDVEEEQKPVDKVESEEYR